jgi:protein TonB
VVLVGHGAILATAALYKLGPSELQPVSPVVSASVSLALTAPPMPVSSQVPRAPRPTSKDTSAQSPKPVALAELKRSEKSPLRPKAIQPVETTDAPTTSIPPQVLQPPLAPASQPSLATAHAVAPPVTPTLSQSSGLPQARMRASAQCIAPSYPRRSILNNEQGVSQLELLIGEDGRVRESRLAESSGFFRLDQAALQALSACEFEPERVNGVAREARARIRYVWRLD